ncbi:MAG: hypothetical protein E7645_07755 [Ruminococcaceae bacterium]|nr:hypothetical protein [Oscillospiraceae bacterium]
MSTSVIEPNRRRMRRETITGLSMGLLCIVFTLIYEFFSHGAFSVHMRMMCLFPFLGCGVLGLLCFVSPLWRYIDRWCFNFWNTAMATFTLGLLFRGIVNISGRFTKLDRLYVILGMILLVIALIFEVIALCQRRKKS